MPNIPDIYMPKDQGYTYQVLGWDDDDVVEVNPANNAEDVFGSLTPYGVYRITCLPATEGRIRVIPASGSDPAAAAYNTAMSYRTEDPVEITLLAGQDRIGVENKTGGACEIMCGRIQ